jgi:hypothetical protein
MPLGEEPEESAHPLIPKEARARQDAFQLLQLTIYTRGGHVPRIHLVFISVQMY